MDVDGQKSCGYLMSEWEKSSVLAEVCVLLSALKLIN